MALQNFNSKLASALLIVSRYVFSRVYSLHGIGLVRSNSRKLNPESFLSTVKLLCSKISHELRLMQKNHSHCIRVIPALKNVLFLLRNSELVWSQTQMYRYGRSTSKELVPALPIWYHCRGNNIICFYYRSFGTILTFLTFNKFTPITFTLWPTPMESRLLARPSSRSVRPQKPGSYSLCDKMYVQVVGGTKKARGDDM